MDLIHIYQKSRFGHIYPPVPNWNNRNKNCTVAHKITKQIIYLWNQEIETELRTKLVHEVLKYIYTYNY